MGPKWPFLLMYGSHDMRHTGFLQVNGGQRDPRDSGHHRRSTCGLDNTFIKKYFM